MFSREAASFQGAVYVIRHPYAGVRLSRLYALDANPKPPSEGLLSHEPASVSGPLRATEARRKAAVRSRWAASEALTPMGTCWAVVRPAGHTRVAIVRQGPAVVVAIAREKVAAATGGTLTCTAQAHTGGAGHAGQGREVLTRGNDARGG